MNSANEVAVELFMQKKIKITDINEIVIHVTETYNNINNPSLDDILNANEEAKSIAKEYAKHYIR
jgi:1-deoxy-D-xylulose-5-phosphate reductoisomerase